MMSLSGSSSISSCSLVVLLCSTRQMQSLFVMQEHMEKLWCERIPMCIEVKGQATPSPNESRSLLLEQWLIQVLPRRSASVCVLRTHVVEFKCFKFLLIVCKTSHMYVQYVVLRCIVEQVHIMCMHSDT